MRLHLFTPDDIPRARQILSELCLGEHKWRMCVPVQEDDSDTILARVIDEAEKSIALENKNQKLRQGADLLIAALADARDIFLGYAENHKKKNPPDIAKAIANRSSADCIDAVLKRYEEWQK